MAVGISVIAEVAQQASSFNSANAPGDANLEAWTIPQLKEFLWPRGAHLMGRKHKLLLCRCGKGRARSHVGLSEFE